MKDDTLPGDLLIVPDWVPSAVAREARELYQFAGFRPAVERIINSRNMKEVWDQFRRRRRGANKFYYQADPNLTEIGEEQRQQTVMAVLFSAAVQFATEPRSLLESKWDQKRFRRWERLAAQLEEAAAEIEGSTWDEYSEPLPESGATIREDALDVLLHGAAVCRDLALNFKPLEREPAGRAFAVAIAELIRYRFQLPGQGQVFMYGVVATITNVALNLDPPATLSNVREWCRGIWARNYRARGAWAFPNNLSSRADLK
jgi:hypothetical protein